MTNSIKLVVLYLLKIIISVLLALLATSVLTILIRAFPDVSGTNTENLIRGILSGVIECAVIFFLFRRDFYNDKTGKIATPLVSFIVALAIRFLLAFGIHFYPYVAGESVSTLGLFLYWFPKNQPEDLIALSDIPAKYFAAPMLIRDVLLIGAFILAFFAARNKRKKERIRESD